MMPEPAVILFGSVITGVGALALLLLRLWFSTVNRRLGIHGQKIDTHDVKIAVVCAQMENLKELGEETRDDVKELLRQANGGRSNRA